MLPLKEFNFWCFQPNNVYRVINIVFNPVKQNQFDSLVGIVISQFISTSAANSIFHKIKAFFNCDFLNENHFETLTVNEIKKLGLTTNKAKTIKELSNLFLDENFIDLTKLEDKILNEK